MIHVARVRSVSMRMLKELTLQHSSGQRTLVYVRRLNTDHHQIMLTPDTDQGAMIILRMAE